LVGAAAAAIIVALIPASLCGKLEAAFDPMDEPHHIHCIRHAFNL